MRNGLNLLLTTTAYPPSIGGAQLLMHQLAREFVPRHRVQVVTQWDTNRTDWLLGTTVRAPSLPRSYEVDGVRVERLSLPRSARLQLAPWVAVYYAIQSAALQRISRALAREVAVWGDSVEIVHNCRIGREGLSYASWQVARERDIPFVFTPVHHPRWGGWLHRHYHRLYRQADAVIALTEAERASLIGLGVEEARLFVTGMGPVLASAWSGEAFRTRYGLGNDPMILFLGQKYAYKGVGTLLTAAGLVWRQLPEARFVFVGPETRYSRKRFAGVRDRRVLNLGGVELQEKCDALAACDVLCLPSSQESFGAVFTEAWSVGKPVVACDIPAVREVVTDGRDGCLVPQEPAAIAERLIYLLERPTLRDEMARLGREKVEARYSWPRLAQLTEQVYRQAMDRMKGGS